VVVFRLLHLVKCALEWLTVLLRWCWSEKQWYGTVCWFQGFPRGIRGRGRGLWSVCLVVWELLWCCSWLSVELFGGVGYSALRNG